MIRLGHSFFLDAQSDGWVLLEVTGEGRDRQTRRFGPFTSARHVLQQRVVKLPKLVRVELRALDEAAGSGDEAVAGEPVTSEPRKGEPPESPPPPRHGPGRTDHDPHSPE